MQSSYLEERWPRLRGPSHIVLAWVICLPGALLFERLGTVLPWMLGPLCFMSLAALLGVPVRSLRGSLQAGQIVVGVALGLYFTPSALGVLAVNAPFVIGGAIFSVFLGLISARCMVYLSKCDSTTGYFASMPGGAADMTLLAQHYGGSVERVAAAQVMRLVVVLVAVPIAITASGAHGSDVWLPSVSEVYWGGLLLSLALGGSVALLFNRLGVPNGWMIGAVFASAVLTGTGTELSAVPRPLTNIAQLLLGCALGSRFTREFLRRAPLFLFWAVVTVVVSILVTASFAWLMHALSGMSYPTLMLAMAPGGITEMAITAQLLQLGVPIVTVFHVARMGFIVFAAAPVYRLMVRWGQLPAATVPNRLG